MRSEPSSAVLLAIRDWLLLVGDQYSIREAHHGRRPDDSLRPDWRNEYFVYRWADSNTDTSNPIRETTASGSSDANIKLEKSFERNLIVDVYAEDGISVLESLYLSPDHPTVRAILKAQRLAIVGMSSIENTTESDESNIFHRYSLTVTVRYWNHFTLLRTDHQFDDYEITGEINRDVGDPIDITITNT